MTVNILDATEEIFGYELTKGQWEIIRDIYDPEINRLIISACTRYGKTRAVAIGTLIYILLNPKKKVLLLAPTRDQTSILRNYIGEHIARTSDLKNLVEINQKADYKRLKKEFSKKRITFNNGCELQTHTAGGSLMGFGGDMIVIDQSEGVSDQKYREEISRMLGDNPNSKLVEIINPWRRNHVWDHWNSERFERIKIDHEQAVKENRLTEEFVEEQKQELTNYEFSVLYEASFPEEGENSLFKYSWLTDAVEREIELEGKNIWGLDVAGGGVDYNVLTCTVQSENKIVLKELYRWGEADTMKTVGKVSNIVNRDNCDEIRVDCIGIGKGVADRLSERGYKVKEVNVGKNPNQDKDRFLNLKSEGFMRLRSLFEENLISFDKPFKGLIGELAEIEATHTSSGKVKIKDPSKSPDRADSLILSCLDLGGGAGYTMMKV